MRTTKKIILASTLISVMLLGIGYAAIQNITLNISGTATVDLNQANFTVKFIGTPSVSDAEKVTASVTNDTNAKINVEGLTAKGEIVTATYTVKNTSVDLSADLSVKTTNSNEEYFIITSELGKTSLTAEEETTLTVTVELIKTPITAEETSTIGIELTAAPVQPGEEGGTSGGSGNTGGTTTSQTLNEYGFYYGVPYSMTVNNVKYSYVFFEDGSAIYYQNEIKLGQAPEGTYVYAEKNISFDGGTLQVSDDGTEIGDASDTAVAELGVTVGSCGIWGHSEDDGLNHAAIGCIGGHFNCEDACSSWQVPTEGTYTLVSAVDGDKTIYNAGETLPDCYESQTGDIFISGDYEYRYGQEFDISNNEWQTQSYFNTWNARVIEDTKTEYGEIYANINNISITDLRYTFANCTSLTKAPVIPDGIKSMVGAFKGCSNLTTATMLPDSVESIIGTFSGCTNLKTYVGSEDEDGDFSAYVLPVGLTSMTLAFCDCSSLTTAPEIPSNVSSLFGTFEGCSSLAKGPSDSRKRYRYDVHI